MTGPGNKLPDLPITKRRIYPYAIVVVQWNPF